MLPKSHRLPSSQIRTLMRSGKKISNSLLQLTIKSNQLDNSRFAFIVSNSIDKRATKRNRIKRLMREAMHRLLPQIRGNVDVMLQARSGNEKEIVKSINELLGRANLL